MSGRGDDRISMYGDDPELTLGPVARALINKARGDVFTYKTETYTTEPQPEGVKFDSGKLRMDLIPPDAMEALARILTDGATKYGCRNWEKGMAWSRAYAALLRHLLAWWGGQDVDPESGHSHLWHVLTNAVFLVAYEQRKVGEDDRPGAGPQVKLEIIPKEQASL